MGERETTILSVSTMFGKTKQKLSALGLECCRIQRKQASSRILPQEEQETWSKCTHGKSEIASKFLAHLDIISLLKAVGKDCRR